MCSPEPGDRAGRHRGGGLRLKVLGFQAEGVIDDELSRAVVAYLRGAGLAWPRQSLEAVAGPWAPIPHSDWSRG
jgi:hypothetical protein